MNRRELFVGLGAAALAGPTAAAAPVATAWMPSKPYTVGETVYVVDRTGRWKVLGRVVDVTPPGAEYREFKLSIKRAGLLPTA